MIEQELIKTLRSFRVFTSELVKTAVRVRQFAFYIPKRKVDRQVWAFIMFVYSVPIMLFLLIFVRIVF